MILLVSNSRDFATDYVVAELLARDLEYYRLDIDLLHEDQVALDPCFPLLQIESQARTVYLTDKDVTAILYRAPTHLRESSSGRLPPEDQLARHQWAAFARSLSVFQHAKWVNHPKDTYLAENKPYQLLIAKQLGLTVPATLIGNCIPGQSGPLCPFSDQIAVKALDSFLVRIANEDAFFYTQRVERSELFSQSFAEMPVIAQHYLSKKQDVRVTVVGEKVFAASITENNRLIDGDWRLAKNRAEFKAFPLPLEIADKCIQLTKALGLIFGAIDLAVTDEGWYFFEINPTGEWAWLVESTNLPITGAIVDALSLG